MNPHPLRNRLLFLWLMLLAPTFANGEKLSDIPVIAFQAAPKPIDLTRLSGFGAHEVVADKKIALINDGRSIRIFSGETKEFFIANGEDIVSFSALTRHETD